MASQLPSFDTLMDLAQNHPEQLEAIRRSLSAEIIEQASPRIRRKLEGINFRVDMERRRSRTPLQSCIRVAAMMHDSFCRMQTELDTLFTPIPLTESCNQLQPQNPYSLRDNVFQLSVQVKASDQSPP